ncbi:MULTISPECIES: RES family NAD+ phosphorylase [Arthrobacter]|uniref:RES domain-containing protein n=1 Tax=Arthrobacter terricola TaxID=2547396 RepID=A0A4R5K4R3_9MICC|nr:MULTISPECIES: RES family NAD+ phosphorylase [Arthrobacter]TDF86891.1 RES domain-containing protein [Arthrobacter terricola]
MVGPVPPPPSPFDPQRLVLPEGTVLHRVYGAGPDGKRLPTSFNPGLGEPTRFAFFDDEHGVPVPVLYAAENVETAVCESIVHHLPAAGGTLFPRQYADRIAAGITTLRPLNLASFRGVGLRHFGLDRSQLTDTDSAWYADTVKWAEAAWKTGLDGCVWTSRRLDSGAAYVFFGHASDAFGISASVAPKVFLNGPDLNWLIDFCAFINIDVEL